MASAEIIELVLLVGVGLLAIGSLALTMWVMFKIGLRIAADMYGVEVKAAAPEDSVI